MIPKNCKVILVTKELGVHEKRWIALLKEEFQEVEPRELHQLEPGRKEKELLIVGPLDSAVHYAETLAEKDYLLLSYAFDVLQEAGSLETTEKDIATLYENSLGIFFDCESVAKTFHQRYGKTKPFCIAAWGLENNNKSLKPTFTARVSGLKEKYQDKKILLSARNFTPLHGVLPVIQGLKLLPGEHEQMALLIVGSGPLEEELKGELRDSSLTYEFLGSLLEEELTYLLQNLVDLYISGAYTDGISVTLLQALTGNVQLALSAVGGNNDLKASPHLSSFTPGHQEEIAAAVASLLKENSSREVLWEEELERLGNWEKNKHLIQQFTRARLASLT